eukprot:scaffold113774_cov32-Tisochrysis_lutea.AAC.4
MPSTRRAWSASGCSAAISTTVDSRVPMLEPSSEGPTGALRGFAAGASELRISLGAEKLCTSGEVSTLINLRGWGIFRFAPR